MVSTIEIAEQGSTTLSYWDIITKHIFKKHLLSFNQSNTTVTISFGHGHLGEYYKHLISIQ